MRKVVEKAGFTIAAQTRILHDRPGPLPEAQAADRSWKYRLGARGRSYAVLGSV